MKPSAAEFGGFLKILRKRADLTVRELEDKSGVSHSYLTQIENGRRGVPSPEILKKLSIPLQIEYDLMMVEAGYIEDDISYQGPIWDTKVKPSKDQLKALFIFGSNLRNIRLQKGISVEEITSSIGFTEDEYLRIEKGDIELSYQTLGKLCGIVGVNDFRELMYTKDYFTEEDHERYRTISNSLLSYNNAKEDEENFIEQIKNGLSSSMSEFEVKKILKEMYEDRIVQIPIYGTIKAGYDYVAEQNIVGYKVAARREVSDGEYFYLIVQGDSMIDEGIREGFHVLVRKQNHVENGKIGVVIVNGDEATLKRVYYDGENVILQSSNKNIAPRVLPIQDVQIQGQVKSVVFDV